MTSKTFKSEVSQGRLSISDTRNGLFTVAVRRGGESVDMIDLKTETAPALALAILEAAGVEPSSTHYGINDSPEWNVRWASHYLGRSMELTEANAAEAKAQTELEAEALELLNASNEAIGVSPYSSMDVVGEVVMRRWLAVARKAREMRAEK